VAGQEYGVQVRSVVGWRIEEIGSADTLPSGEGVRE